MIRKVTAILIAVLLILSFAACGTKTTDNSTDSNADVSTEEQATVEETVTTPDDPTISNVNKTVTVGSLEITVKYSRTFKKAGYATAKDGNQFVVIGADVKNNGSSAVTSDGTGSSLLALLLFAAKDNPDNSQYNLVLGTSQASGVFENLTTIAAGETATGELIYEMPDTVSMVYLELTDEKLQNKQLVPVPLIKAE